MAHSTLSAVRDLAPLITQHADEAKHEAPACAPGG